MVFGAISAQSARHQTFGLLIQFAYLFLIDLYGKSFTETIHLVRQDKFISIIEFVYTAAARGASLNQVKMIYRWLRVPVILFYMVNSVLKNAHSELYIITNTGIQHQI